MSRAPANIHAQLDEIDLTALCAALHEATQGVSYDVAVVGVTRTGTVLDVRVALPAPDGAEDTPRDRWFERTIHVDSWCQHDLEDEGRFLLTWAEGVLDPGCELVEVLAEEIEDERCCLPSTPSLPTAPAVTDEPLEGLDRQALLLSLKGDAEDAYDNTAHVVGLELDGAGIVLEVLLDPSQDGEASPGRIRLPWTGSERFRFDAMEALGRLLVPDPDP